MAPTTTVNLNVIPAFCGAQTPLPTNEVDVMLPVSKTAGLLGGNAKLVMSVANYGQTVSFLPTTYTYTSGSTTVSGAACQPTIVNWDSTYHSSFVTSTQTVVGKNTFYTPFLTATDSATTGCFFTATIAENAACMTHFTVTTTYTSVIAGVTQTPVATLINAFGALDFQALTNTNEASSLYPFILTYPFQATSATLTSGNLNTAVTFSVVSEDFTVTNAVSGSGLLNFVISSVPADNHYIVSTLSLLNPSVPGAYVTTANTAGRFAFNGLAATCGGPQTWNAQATICRVDPNVPQTSNAAGSCLSGSSPDVDATFQITANPSTVAPGSGCTFTIAISAISDISATIVDVTSTPPTASLYATDQWQVQLQSSSLQQIGQYISVNHVKVGDGSGSVIELDASCFTSVASGFGLNTFSFPAKILPLGISSYAAPPASSWTPTSQLCSSGFLLSNKAATTYTFNFSLQFDSTTVPGAPLRRRDMLYERDSSGSGSSGSQVPKSGVASLSFTVDTSNTGNGTGGKDNGGLSGGAIAGIVAGSVASAVIWGCAIWRRNSRCKEQGEDNQVPSK